MNMHPECGQLWIDHADDGVQMLCPDDADEHADLPAERSEVR